MTRERPAWRSPLTGTILCSVLLLLAISVWLLADERTSRSDALRTGGLAGGAVIALYALWLNDRRRRIEEARHELESSRVSDERFARSIELLGHDTDQVRVGAMHALAGLARSRPEYTQTVLDVLCSYLRRPFHHPRFQGEPDATDRESERELQVRLTAQRLVVDLLPQAGTPGAPSYDLDLTGAALEYLDLSGRRLGTVVLRYTYLHSSTNVSECEFTGPVWFTSARTGHGRLAGRFLCRNAVFHERAWFAKARFTSIADFTGTTFAGETSFRGAVFAGDALLGETSFPGTADLRDARFHGYLDLRWTRGPQAVPLDDTLVEPDRGADLPDGWTTEELPDGRTRLTAPAT
ncbi:pentapeptide repeat protein [Prauserella shujinwangii]|uniref:Pentapeptide repeat protein n=1 Tax=Prauserella shujinwangii TaxID=1453103 RepID=A0A2T0LUG3_9PSEU|nr:pentapeptide repeat-containing protein [Prauserella shujinwangii]PRX47456.1 pentapeptide repeat protein [Prauserella shujinwangii]